MKSFFGWLKNSTKIKRWIALMIIGMVLACYGFAQIMVLERLELIDIIKIVLIFAVGASAFILGLTFMQKRTLELAVSGDKKENKITDSKDKGYYLFNYGHEITHWTIKVDDVDSNGDGIIEEGECAYVWTNGVSWNASNAVSFVNVSDSTKTNMQKLAAYLDEIYQTPKNITLTPTWNSVQIKVKSSKNGNDLIPPDPSNPSNP